MNKPPVEGSHVKCLTNGQLFMGVLKLYRAIDPGKSGAGALYGLVEAEMPRGVLPVWVRLDQFVDDLSNETLERRIQKERRR